MSPADGCLRGAPHIWPVRVYFEDTDAGGVVYYANYLKFAERGRTEMLRAAGFDHVRILAELGVQFVVRGCKFDYAVPARLDDVLEVRSRVATMSGASFTIRQEIFRSGQRLVEADLRLACVDRLFRPARLPAELKLAFSAPDPAAPGG
jgi:acyl-CoA thioester hydrolase